MFTVEQCVWQFSLCPVKAHLFDRPQHRVFKDCLFVCFVNDCKTFCHAYKSMHPHSIGLFLLNKVFLSYYWQDKGTESSWLKCLWLLVALKKQNFTIGLKLSVSLACVQF